MIIKNYDKEGNCYITDGFNEAVVLNPMPYSTYENIPLHENSDIRGLYGIDNDDCLVQCVVLRFSDKSEKDVWVGRYAYIVNDQGKTVEKVSPPMYTKNL